MTNGWTPERKRRQAELIKKWRPWEKSTGPKTAAGKRASARRGYKGAARIMLRALGKALREQKRGLENIGA